jgi:hypothetical protein
MQCSFFGPLVFQKSRAKAEYPPPLWLSAPSLRFHDPRPKIANFLSKLLLPKYNRWGSSLLPHVLNVETASGKINHECREADGDRARSVATTRLRTISVPPKPFFGKASVAEIQQPTSGRATRIVLRALTRSCGTPSGARKTNVCHLCSLLNVILGVPTNYRVGGSACGGAQLLVWALCASKIAPQG